MLLHARNLSKSFATQTLFTDVSLQIADGDRLGMIGPNGAGKSTLVKILAGLESEDEGEITRRRGLGVSYVRQDDVFPDGATPMSAVCDVLQRWPHDHALDDETRASITLSKLGFEHFDQPIDALSGGWRKRISIACALATEPDVLMLDEPTNHLDLEGVLWLEQFVLQADCAVVFITHDRTFLENTATRVIELSPAYPNGTFEVTGNYSEFIRRKDAFLEAQAAQQSALANTVRRDTAWLQQGIQGRQTRNKTQVADSAQRRAELKQIARRNTAPKKTTAIDFQATERKTNKLLALHNVAKSMGGKKLFDSLDLMLSPGDRIGLLGRNGSGKTTLLRLLSGDLQPDEGTIKRADQLRVVTFTQHRGTLDSKQTLQEALCPNGDTVDYRGKQLHVTGWARKFLFDFNQLHTFVGNLSGGEQARVLIANLMLEPADILLLDEPTNDLDIPSLEVLEQALLEFPGAIVLVTHDRFMLERIATEYIGLDGKGNAKQFATFEQWMRSRTTDDDTAKKSPKRKDDGEKKSKPQTQSKPGKRKLSYNEQREFDSIEQRILDAEAEVQRLEAESQRPAVLADHEQAATVFQQLTEAQQHVQQLYNRWAELESIQSG